MKKIFTLFAFALIGFTANAQIKISVSNKPSTFTYWISADECTIYHRVNWVDQIGSKEEISKEIKARKALISEYKKEGYVFDKLERTPKGLFMRFVKG